jgi:hypothetical protein
MAWSWTNESGRPTKRQPKTQKIIDAAVEVLRGASPDDVAPLDAAASAVFGNGPGIPNGRTLSRASRSGHLVTYWIAGKLFTTIEDVLAWVRSTRVQRVPATSPPAPYQEPLNNAPATAAEARAAMARAQAAIDALR